MKFKKGWLFLFLVIISNQAVIASAWDELPRKTASSINPHNHNAQIYGTYRLAAGVEDEVVFNESNINQNLFGLQGPNSRYPYGGRTINTYDPAIYSRHVLNVDFSPFAGWTIAGQMVNDPWSLVGTTGDQYIRGRNSTETIRYNLKYFGAFNGTIAESVRANTGDRINIPEIEVHNGETQPTFVEGFDDFDGVPGNNRGLPFLIPQTDIDFEYRPMRKLWAQYEQDDLKARIFALADERQAQTTDDPLTLSNNHAYWQWSPWLENYEPLQHFSDGSVKRGYYANNEAYSARDSSGNRLVLLRGASLAFDNGSTSVESTVAAPLSPWESRYFKPDNLAGVLRVKQQVTEKWMLGGVYTSRTGFIDTSVADSNQVWSMDTKYQFTEAVSLKAQAAVSEQQSDLLSDESIGRTDHGNAQKIVLDNNFDAQHFGDDSRSEIQLSFAMMDRQFNPGLSRYSTTRDDFFWSQHLRFDELSPDLEAVKIGDGLDRDRYVFRARWKEKLFKERFTNLFDARNVHKQSNGAYKETVIRDEITFKATDKLTLKSLARWHGMPNTTRGEDPFIANFYFDNSQVDLATVTFQNIDVRQDLNADRGTFSAGAQYVFDKQWTAEGIYERTNNVPDFPRGILVETFRNANDRIDGILTDRITPFFYSQQPFDVPRYNYYDIFKERVIYSPHENVKVIFHATQNGYALATGIDDNIEHQGISLQYRYSEKLEFFADYTHSEMINVPKLVSSRLGDQEAEDHHNVYMSMDYKLKPDQIFRAEYGVFGLGSNAGIIDPYSVSTFTLPTVDTEHLLRLSLSGDF